MESPGLGRLWRETDRDGAVGDSGAWGADEADGVCEVAPAVASLGATAGDAIRWRSFIIDS